MLNKTKVALLGAMAAVAFIPTVASAQATESADARATIIPAVQLVETAVLDFGSIVPGAVAAPVTLSQATGNRGCDAALTCAGTSSRGIFTVSGAPVGMIVAVTVPGNVTLSAGGTNTMTVALSANPTLTSTGAPQPFYVGGTLTVGANQAAGTYTGSYIVTANYQ